ncbi:MAG: cation:proton antiporter [Acutalibacteraceae bacterium]|nr:cation:proton antiporter [Acutalibacteraceae bacterium]
MYNAAYELLLDLGIIFLAAKLCGLVSRQIKVPPVVGQIFAGVILAVVIPLISPSLSERFSSSNEFLNNMAEIGVILLMFMAGLGTNIKMMIRTGPVALFIALMGVLVPLVMGTAGYMIYYGKFTFAGIEFYKALFIGVIMTATSVSITVQALRDMGCLQGKVGTTIVSAAIIDDIIGIIVLTFVIGTQDESSVPLKVALNTVLFFIFAFIAGYIVHKIFEYLERKYPHTHRITIIALAFCFIMSYCAEKLFGIADITGAFVSGVVLCSLLSSEYITSKIDTSSYMFFGPIFFVCIGLKVDFNEIANNISILGFAVVFVVIALISKIIGCSAAAKICKYNWADSLKIGCGMMTRGEVALIVANKGLAVGLIDEIYFTPVILLIIISSFLSPILLKLIYNKYPDKE